jgi:hypothetical protein
MAENRIERRNRVSGHTELFEIGDQSGSDGAPAELCSRQRAGSRHVVPGKHREPAVMLIDYGSLPPGQRNILRFIFLDPRARAAQYDWESVARFALGSFRVDSARAGAAAEVEPLVDELRGRSPEFKAMWDDNEVRGPHGDSVKHIRHPVLGPLAFEYSAFAVDGRTDLNMVVYNPATPADAQRIKSLLAQTAST